MRTRIAHDLSGALDAAGDTPIPQAVHGAIADLRRLVDELEKRAHGGPKKRGAAAARGAGARKDTAAQRSARARSAARTRAKSAG